MLFFIEVYWTSLNHNRKQTIIVFLNFSYNDYWVEKLVFVYRFLRHLYKNILAVIGGVVSTARIIVKITPTTKDDDILDKVINVLVKFSIINTKKDQEKIDSK